MKATTSVTAAGSEPLEQMRAAVAGMADELKALAARLPAQRALSKRQAAQLLGVSRGRTLDRLIREGTLRAVLIGTRSRIPMSEIERLLQEGAPSPLPARPAPRRSPAPRATRRPPDVAAELAKARAIKVSDL